MKVGIQLHSDRGADATLDEARLADEQGFDSVWLFDHLLGFRGTHVPTEPLDSFTLMTAVGAVTSRVRLAWAMLNPSFRNAAVLAKMLATLDVITHGRVICSLGAGWFEEEYRAYDLHFFEHHADRIRHEREVVLLLKELWTHPAPHQVTFEGEFVKARNLAFNPAPVQQPHPPIWIGGDSDDTLSLVKEAADGWVMLRSGNPQTLASVLSSSDWPTRPMTVARTAQVYVGLTHDSAVDQARAAVESGQAGQAKSLEELLKIAVVGTPEECIQRFDEMESWGINYLRLGFWSEAQQRLFAETALPRMLERPSLVPTRG
jgi:alkanesulfonate monooxygenase SsuD/methylene tetrahydromethanopterin reductase-like flavin-dependent oxidoreductase (luciferase family)